jgi:histidinol-phosphate aminotransferase
MNTDTPKITSLFRAHFQDMDGYISAGMEEQKSADKLFLNANENPYELPGLEGYNRYPEPQPHNLARAMAEFYGVETANLVITRGADEGIAMLTRLFVEPGQDKILINPPTFGVYKVYANAMPSKDIIQTPLLKNDGTFKLDVGGIKDQLDNTAHLKLIYITNPNNPTGNTFAKADIEEILNAASGKAIVVLDETYAEFAPQCSFADRLGEFPNLIILRTLSKSFSMAGMRVGAILSGVSDVIETLKTKVMEVYPIPQESAKAALHVLSPDILKQAKNNIQTLIGDRKKMEEFWAAQEGIIHVYPSDANFLLIEMLRASDFANYCKEHGVILRDFSKSPLTENALRISIGTPEQNDLVQSLYREFIGEKI